MAEIIEIEANASLAAIRSKLATASTNEVILVVPRQTRSLQSAVGTKVLARAVADYHLRLALVTRDGDVSGAAREGGFSVFNSVKQAESSKHWKTPRQSQRQPLPPRQTTTQKLTAKAVSSHSWPERILGAGLLLVLLVIVGAGSAMLLPEGKVHVRPASQEIAVEVRLAVIKDLADVDYQKVAIPGHAVTTIVQGTWSQPTTSRKDMPQAIAKGEVLFINQLTMPVSIPSGTLVSTGSGTAVRFRTTQEGQLPGQRGSSVVVPVEAVDPGPQGNVGPYMINTMLGTLASQVRVINEKATEAGSMVQVGVVTNADRERLHTALLQRLENEAHTALQPLLKEDEIAPRETLRMQQILGEAYDKMLGEAADQLTLTLRTEFGETAFKAMDANRMALAGLQGAVPKGYALQSQSLSFAITGIELDESGNLFVRVSANGTVVSILNEGEIRSLVLGATPEEAVQQLSGKYALAEPPKVSVSPSWMDTLPRFPFRVKVEIEGQN